MFKLSGSLFWCMSCWHKVLAVGLMLPSFAGVAGLKEHYLIELCAEGQLEQIKRYHNAHHSDWLANTFSAFPGLKTFGFTSRLSAELFGPVNCMHAAAANGHVEVVQYLCEQGVSPNQGNVRHYTPLHMAAILGKTDVVSQLVGNQADINAVTVEGKTPLALAIKHQHQGIALALISEGAAVFSPERSGETALHYAARWGDAAVIGKLLEAGAPVNTVDSNDNTPLVLAAEDGRVDAVKLLIGAGACVNVQNCKGLTPLMRAARKGRYKTVQKLLSLGADPLVKAKGRYTALTEAADYGHLNIINALLEYAAGDKDKIAQMGGTGALLNAASRGHTNAVEALLQAGVGINNDRVPLELQPLYLAAQGGYLETVKVLVTHGARLNGDSNSFLMPLQIATELGHVEVAEYLLKQGATPEWLGRGPLVSPLQIAAAISYPSRENQRRSVAAELIDALVVAGADVNRTNPVTQATPLQLAASAGHPDAVLTLLKHGANPDFKTAHSSLTPLQRATLCGHGRTTQVLLQAHKARRKEYQGTSSVEELVTYLGAACISIDRMPRIHCRRVRHPAGRRITTTDGNESVTTVSASLGVTPSTSVKSMEMQVLTSQMPAPRKL